MVTIQHTVWLADDLALLHGSFGGPGTLMATVGTEGRPLGVARLCLSDRDGPKRDLVALRLPINEIGGLGAERPLRFEVDGRYVGTTSTADLARTDVEIDILARRHLAARDARHRAAISDFVLESTLASAGTHATSRRLATLRGLLRERHAAGRVERSIAPGAVVEQFVAADDHTFYLRGWLSEVDRSLARVVAVSPEGERVVVHGAHRSRRDDVNEFYGRTTGPGSDLLGFAAHLTTVVPSLLDDGWILEITAVGLPTVEVSCPTVERRSAAVRTTLLGDLDIDPEFRTDLCERHLHPAIARTEERRQSTIVAARVERLGPSHPTPRISVLVPLYRRVDFVEHQLAQFTLDVDFAAEVELVYVLDSPELDEAFRAEMERLHRFYELPFTTVTLSANAGFALANNIGARHCRGNVIILCNSDVLPESPGWASVLADFLRREGVVAVGPRLVYEDGSLQHAGMYFDRPRGTAHWRNEHYFKGLGRDFAPAEVPRPVPAVSAACLAVERERFLGVGGLSGSYVQGDYEDSDLCFRLTDAGGEVWYLPEVTLAHLEGASYPPPERVRAGRYNAWLHHRTWDERISDLMARTEHHPAEVARRWASP